MPAVYKCCPLYSVVVSSTGFNLFLFLHRYINSIAIEEETQMPLYLALNRVAGLIVHSFRPGERHSNEKGEKERERKGEGGRERRIFSSK